MNDLILKEKVVVISGGTKGVGRAAAIECSRQGAKVVFGGRDSAAAEDILRQISSHGGEGRFIPPHVPGRNLARRNQMPGRQFFPKRSLSCSQHACEAW